MRHHWKVSNIAWITETSDEYHFEKKKRDLIKMNEKEEREREKKKQK